METLYAYLAGAIDIDGRILIERVHGSRRRNDGRQVSYYKATIKLSDSSPMLPDLLQATFQARRLRYEARNRKQAEWHMWEAVNQTAHEPVARLLPYLKLKHRQAELALTLITLIKHDKAGSGRPLTDEQEQARHRLFEEARLLNDSRPRRMYR
jgi:hypothetical protein